MFLEAIGKVSKKRLHYVEGKREAYTSSIILTTEQKKEVMKMIRGDVQFFVEQNLMDYSMIVAIKHVDREHAAILSQSAKTHEDMHNYFEVRQGDKLYIVYVGIIFSAGLDEREESGSRNKMYIRTKTYFHGTPSRIC
jgi:hypothetical protein